MYIPCIPCIFFDSEMSFATLCLSIHTRTGTFKCYYLVSSVIYGTACTLLMFYDTACTRVIIL